MSLKTKRMHNNKTMPGKLLWGFTALLLTLAFFSTTHIAQAQITKSARVQLDGSNVLTFIGPQSYATLDPEKHLTYNAVINRHQNNLRGARQNKNSINFGPDAAPTWVVFSVTNTSNTENWILHFGRLIDGRAAIAKSLMVRNHSIDETIIDTSKVKAASNTFGAAVPIKLRKGQTELFAVYIDPEESLLNTITPFLITERDYLSITGHGDAFFIMIAVFIVGLIGFFMAVSFIRRNLNYLLFSGYYFLNGLLFILLSKNFLVSFHLFGEALSFLYAASILLGLIMTKFFLRITTDEHKENLALMGCFGFLAASSFIGLFLFKNSTVNDLLIFVPASAILLIIAALSFFKGQAGKYAGVHYAAAWVAIFIGGGITAMAAADILPINTYSVNAYWFALFPQAYFFMLAVKKKIELLEEEDRHKRSRESREVQSRARLKHSKESADQARLLRVIERERELMADLREREMQRTEEMRVAKEMADEANRAKSAFLAVVSHEIRTPMTGILGMVRLLGDTTLNKDQKDYLLAVQKSGETMMALLNDILDFEKIERGSMELEAIDFDLGKLAQGVVMLMSGHAADKEVALEVDISPGFPDYVIGDPTRLRQVLLNLVNNAIKFTEEGKVTIQLRATDIAGKQEGITADYEVYFAVEDTGIGISDAVQESLFTPFEQADSTVSRRYGGTGLGLAICKRLVEAMGGAISVTSQEHIGSTFHFSILMNKGRAEASDAIEHSTGLAPKLNSASPMHLLIIEDNEMNQKVLAGFLAKAGHTTHMVDSGEEAIGLLETNNFDAVLSDVNLTGMSGLETAKLIRGLSDTSKSQIPIIAISGNVSQEDIDSYYEAGLNGFLAKPIDPEKLYGIIEDIQNGTLKVAKTAEPATAKPEEAINAVEAEEPSLQEEPSAEAEMAAENKDSESSALLDFAAETASKEFDSFADADAKIEASENEENSVLDMQAAQNLIDTLGAEQFSTLMESYVTTADSIIDDLLSIKDSDDTEVMRDKAHEIKGMAANFGVKIISDISDVIENSAKNGDIETARQNIEKLPDANRRAKDSIAKLISDVD